MQTTTLTVRDRLYLASEDLSWDYLTIALTAGTKTTGDAWCEATEKHGERIAHIHLPDGVWSAGQPRYYTQTGAVNAKTLYVNYPFEDVEAGKAIQQALVAQGFTVEWDGDGTRAIQIHLDR